MKLSRRAVILGSLAAGAAATGIGRAKPDGDDANGRLKAIAADNNRFRPGAAR